MDLAVGLVLPYYPEQVEGSQPSPLENGSNDEFWRKLKNHDTLAGLINLPLTLSGYPGLDERCS